jgi:hypothetical protein
MEINFLWIGDKLGKLEQLTLKSFVDNGHQPVVWLYNTACAGIPEGVLKRDANEILPSSRIFSYEGRGDCRAGSYGGFSDLFRYYLLKTVGGWYCDMDVTCLQSFADINNSEYVIRPHNTVEIVGNIIKTPKNAPFLDDCIALTEKHIDKRNDRWVKPVEILRDCVKKHSLEQYLAPIDWFGNDNIEDIRHMLSIGVFCKKELQPKYALHWCNEATSTGQWDYSIKRNFNKPIPTTLFYNLLKKHKLL